MLKRLLIALSLIALTQPAFAEPVKRVLYMEVDGGKKMLSKNHPAYRHIFQETGDYLENRANLRLIGERSVPERRSFKKALKDAEQINPDKLDAIVMVSLRRDVKRNQGSVKNRMIAMARILDPYSLDIIDEIKIKSPVAKVRAGECGRECRYHIGKRHVLKILPRFQKQLARSLRHVDVAPVKVTRQSSGKYTLTLRGFSEREVRFLEDRIARLDGTRDLSSLRSKQTKPVFWLERDKKAVALRDDLADVLTRLDLQARIIETPNMITLVKVNRNVAWLD